MAKKEKKPVHKVVMTEGKRNIIHQLFEEYDIETADDIQDALKDLLGGTIKEMMEAEMTDHLGYEKSERSDSTDYRNDYKSKKINTSYGSMEIEVPLVSNLVNLVNLAAIIDQVDEIKYIKRPIICID